MQLQDATRCLIAAITAAEAFQSDAVGETTRLNGIRVPISRFQACVPDKTTTGAIAVMPLWAGESVGAVKRIQPAAQKLALDHVHIGLVSSVGNASR